MADELINLRIDQMELGQPTPTDFGVYRDMVAGLTKKYDMAQFIVSPPSQNFAWVSNYDYDFDEFVTYQGQGYTSSVAGIDTNTGNIPSLTSPYWTPVATPSSGFVFWQAGAYTQTEVFVLHLLSDYIQIFRLVNVTRPYTSTNLLLEYASGDWDLLSETGYIGITKVAHGFAIDNVLTIKSGDWNLFVLGDKQLAIVKYVIDADHVIVVGVGPRVKVFTGLTPGAVYYAQNNSTFSTIESPHPLFVALTSTTAMLIASGDSSTSIPEFINANGQAVYIALGDQRIRGNGAVPGPTPLPNTVYEFEKATNTVVAIGSSDFVDATNGSAWPKFGIDVNSDTGTKPVIVHLGIDGATAGAHGGDGGNNFSSTGDNYPLLLSKATAALSVVGVQKVSAIFISIGFAESADSEATIYTAIADLVTRLTSDFGNRPIIFIKEVSTGSDNKKLSRVIRDILFAFPNVSVGVDLQTLQNAGNLPATDPTQTGNNKIGEMMARHVRYLATRSKVASSVLSMLHEEITTARQNLLATLMDTLSGNGSLENNIDFLAINKQSNEYNAYQGLNFLYSHPRQTLAAEVPTYISNDSLSVDGISKFLINPIIDTADYVNASQDDIIVLCRAKDNVTVSSRWLFGFNNGVTSAIGLKNEGVNIEYVVHDAAFTSHAGNIVDGVSGVMRINNDISLFQGGTVVDTANVASVAFTQSPGFGYLAGFGLYHQAKFQWVLVAKASGLDIAETIAAIDNVIDNW